jgi:hypothetical protein
MNAVFHSVPFRKDITSQVRWETNPEPLTFKTIQEVQYWSAAVKQIADSLFVLCRLPQSAQPFGQYIDAFIGRKGNIIDTPLLGEEICNQPYVLLKDYCQNLVECWRIADSAQIHLRRLTVLRMAHPSNTAMIAFFAFVAIALISGVILPLAVQRINKWFLIYLPIGSYLFMMCCVL